MLFHARGNRISRPHSETARVTGNREDNFTTFEVCTHSGFSVSTKFADHQHTSILPPWRARSHPSIIDYHLDVLLPLLMFTHGADQYGKIDRTEVVRRMRQATVLFVSKDSEYLYGCLSDGEEQQVKSMYQEHCTKLNAIFVDYEHNPSDNNSLATQTIIHVHRLLKWNRGRIKFCSIPASILATNNTQSPAHMTMVESFASAFASSSRPEVMPGSSSASSTTYVHRPLALRIVVPPNDDAPTGREELPSWEFNRVARLLHALVLLFKTWAQERSILASVLLETVPFRVGSDSVHGNQIIQVLHGLREVQTQFENADISSVLTEINNWLHI